MKVLNTFSVPWLGVAPSALFVELALITHYTTNIGDLITNTCDFMDLQKAVPLHSEIRDMCQALSMNLR